MVAVMEALDDVMVMVVVAAKAVVVAVMELMMATRKTVMVVLVDAVLKMMNLSLNLNHPNLI
jgi:uncharacterized protein with von Willebrand factor type A (vWA) domain